MPVKLPNGKHRVQIRIKGHPPVDRVFDKKKDAVEFERTERERIKSKAPLYTLEMTFRQAWEAYHGSMLFRAKKPTTQRTEESRIGRALKVLGPYSLAQLIDGQVLSRFRDQLGSERVQVKVRPEPSSAATSESAALVDGARRDGKADGTLSNDAQRLVLAAVSSVMLWCVENNLMVRNPMRGIKKPKAGQRDRRMERDEELNIYLLAKSVKDAGESINEDARYVAIQRELGCRPAELNRLLRSDVDLDASAVRFRDTKNGETRIIHTVQEAKDLLGAQLLQGSIAHPDSPYLFTSLSRSGHKPVPFNHSGAIRRLREAGIVDEDFHSHAARREFASAAFEAGLPVEDIRKQTGHKSIKALEVYNQSESLHPQARQRVEAAGRKRAQERFNDLAEALGVSPAELREFQRKAAGGASAVAAAVPAAPGVPNAPEQMKAHDGRGTVVPFITGGFRKRPKPI